MKPLPPILLQTLRSRWFAMAIHAGLWVLLYLAIVQLGGKTPPYTDAAAFSAPPQTLAPVAKLDSVVGGSGAATPATNAVAGNPFRTLYFVPPPTPTPPPPPTTRKIDVTYHGFYQTTNGPTVALLTVAEGLMSARIGALVATNVYVASANFTNVILTNTTGKTNVLPLNTKQAIEVPIR